MSQILAADKRSNGQALQGRGPRYNTGSSYSKGKFAGSSGKTYVGVPFGVSPNSPHQLGMTEIKKSLQKNVFIDSYYPKVQGDSTETTRSHSSYEKVHLQAFPAYSPIAKESSFVGSSSIFGRTPKYIPGNRTFAHTELDLVESSSSIETIASPNLDTQTYILLSSSSDVDSNCVNISQTSNKKFFLNNIPVNELQLEGGDSPADCFTQLYNRIHNLEELLQQTLLKSIPAVNQTYAEETEKSEEGPPEMVYSKTEKAKGKISLATGMTKAWVSTCLPSTEGIDAKENTDTECELKKIKKRLKVLEKKLKKGEKSQPSTLPLHRNQQGSATSSSHGIIETNDRCNAKYISESKNTESTETLISDTESFIQSEVAPVKIEAEIPGKKRKSKVKKKIISKCRNIKKKCSSIVNFSRSPPQKLSATKGWQKVLYKHSVVTNESVATTLFNQSFSAHTRTDSSTVFYVKCQQKTPLGMFSQSRKKKGKKRKYLCKKNSKTNIFSTCSNEMPVGDTFIFGDYDRSRSAALRLCDSKSKPPPPSFDENLWSHTPWKGIAVELPAWPNFLVTSQNKFCSQPSDHQQKSTKKGLSFRNPLEVLKRGGKIKIPVLFEEICRTSQNKEPEHKLSNISMRFVVVHEENEHPLTPLRKLVKKLSQTKTFPKEQFVFGVSKCRCNSQVNRPSSVFETNEVVDSSVATTRVAFVSLQQKKQTTRLPPLLEDLLSEILDYLLDITTRYNGLARVWLGGLLLVHISRPEDAEILLSSHKLIEKNRMYRFFDDVLGQGLLNARGDVWRKHRKIIAPTFHPSILKHFVKIFSEQSRILVKVLEKNADGRIFNIFPYVRNCALDFITETALENHIGAQLRVVAPATRAAERLMNITYNRMFKLWLYSDFIFYRTQQGKEYLRLRDLVKESTEPLLEVKKKEVAEGDMNRNTPEATKRKSFFRQLVELNENADNFNDKELRDEVVTMIITGYETTAATVGFILVMLGIHQDIQAKVYEEVVAMQEILKGRELEAEDLTHFEYMDRVIKETLRLYPVGPIIFRECTSDVNLTTCTIPKGASVAVVILRMHRDPAIWDNPNSFDPDHFLPEKCDKRHPYAYIPFSAGPRNCIGKQYAYLSMRVMLFHILSNYRVLCDLRDEDIRIKSEVTMKMVGGFKIRLLPRRQQDDE